MKNETRKKNDNDDDNNNDNDDDNNIPVCGGGPSHGARGSHYLARVTVAGALGGHTPGFAPECGPAPCTGDSGSKNRRGILRHDCRVMESALRLDVDEVRKLLDLAKMSFCSCEIYLTRQSHSARNVTGNQ